ncbi:MAG: hypothetical protein CFE24_14230 [Flavobacterium sp. BFFFF2]|nr:MAG: hypothetical protein CFE24_14230 [Flavobacterium sp. BFFFF2]
MRVPSIALIGFLPQQITTFISTIQEITQQDIEWVTELTDQSQVSLFEYIDIIIVNQRQSPQWSELLAKSGQSIHSYLVCTSQDQADAYDAWKAGADDFILAPWSPLELENVLFEKPNNLKRVAEKAFYQHQPLQIGIKSYGDHRYFSADQILYLKADNNSTDIHLTDETITAFKTLKHFENTLPFPHFMRIHNSYLINTHQLKRIQLGNNLCYIGASKIKVPFSKSYKHHVDFLMSHIAKNNYLEL